MKYMTRLLCVALLVYSTYIISQNDSLLPFYSNHSKYIDGNSIEIPPLKAVIEDLLAALREGEIKKAYELTSDRFKKTTSFEQFKQFVGNYAPLSQNKYFQFNSMNYEKSIAAFQGTLISKNGEAIQAEFDLTEKKGKWEILGIQLFKPETGVLRPEE